MSWWRRNLEFYCGVQCVVLRRGAGRVQEVLLGLRVRTTGAGLWSLPGGHVERNESPIETARRELMEEVGLVGLDARVGPAFFTYGTRVPYAHVPVLFESVEGTATANPKERFAQVDYFSLTALPDKLFEPSALALREIAGMPAELDEAQTIGASW